MGKDYFVPFSEYGEDKFEEKHSKFTGRLWRVESAEQAVARVKQMRDAHWDATHNCWAYIIREGNLMRYSDDGEPQGTAGMPILDVLRHEKLENVCCVVTRYFGGTLLGAGGLVRAYSKGAKIAVDAGGIVTMRLCDVLTLKCDYAFLGKAQNAIAEADGQILNCDYTEEIDLKFSLPEGGEHSLNRRLAEFSAGRFQAQKVDILYRQEEI